MAQCRLDPGTQELLKAHARGELSATMTAAKLLVWTRNVDGLREGLRTHGPANGRLGQASAAVLATLEHSAEAAQAMLELLDRDAAMLDAPAASIEDRLACCRDLFDWAVKHSPQGSVAVYSFGSQRLLDAATAELVALLGRLGVVWPEATILDIGCGIGRLEVALAGRAAGITGIDLSPAMIAHARKRCRPYPNVTLQLSPGKDLCPFARAAFDTVLMVDTFPYLYRAGGSEFAGSFMAEIARVLRPGGHAVIFNFSYRGDHALDRRDAAEFAAELGLELLRNGRADLRSWDGLTFQLRKRA